MLLNDLDLQVNVGCFCFCIFGVAPVEYLPTKILSFFFHFLMAKDWIIIKIRGLNT